ncbi:L-glutamate gamma-semialdehyde dehydrogenase [Pseudobacteriovorax antillogorgiicola]|uniref:L-glutamate gamma-semialdehyde dehydrogenase n=1 Tax=Pseudobacteriovorax antillogorgiicola TaxID=1513793 RepID=A0A1Y6BJ03_9BACT|nr:L-glutamate gamma-semialdehyde dehydrogenase [Pseudobacteriovorax antillogorgiicola]TCS56434.1 delta-1-pyrroline-5-carboxylate dehydrogenase [Pseudobacteriovorax antillogorgiicola]SMF05532.1 delta-1-pyrroline-5-carboxylate dehydrogenase [Pseudobacteriovorax antillogorgiicola]
MSNARSITPKPSNEPVLAYSPGTSEREAVIQELKRQKSEITQIPMVIDGDKIFTDTKDKVVCPHDHQQVIAEVSQGTADHAKSAIDAALKARKEWAALPWEARAAVFLKAADLLATKYRAEMNAATMLGQSKTVHQAEIDAACELIDFFRFNVHYAEQIYSEQPGSAFGMWNRSEIRGLEGFVYAITPFNFTSIAVNLPAAPALMGCAVIWKPAPTSMHGAYLGLRILEEAGLPKGVINMISGDPQELSSVLLPHPELSGIHFTGSTATFNHLWQEVGKNINNYRYYPRIVGETGGKDFVFAHSSADAQELCTALVRGAFEFQGQKCSAASRAYVPKSLWSKLKPALVETVKSIKMGDVEDFHNFMSAVIDKRSFDKIASYIDHAKQAKDAEIVVGGEYDDSKGYFIRPTIIEASNPHYKSMVEEIFGPVLTIYVYEDEAFEETLAICDSSTKYALTGAIFAKDRHVIDHMAKTLVHAAGNFYINDKPTGAVVGQQPFGGGRASGTNDKAGSMLNLLRWASFRTVKENFLSITDYRYPFMGQ